MIPFAGLDLRLAMVGASAIAIALTGAAFVGLTRLPARSAEHATGLRSPEGNRLGALLVLNAVVGFWEEYQAGNTIDALVADQVRTKLLVEAVMCTFAQEVQIKLSKDRTEPI